MNGLYCRNHSRWTLVSITYTYLYPSQDIDAAKVCKNALTCAYFWLPSVLLGPKREQVCYSLAGY